MEEHVDEQLSNILEDHFAALSHSLEDYMRQNDQSIAEERKDFYMPQINELQEKIKEGEEIFTEMEEHASQVTTMLVKKEAVLAHMVQLSARLHQKIRNGNSYSRAFNRWTEIGTDKEVLAKVYERIYIVNAAKRIFFKRWVRKMYKQRENRFIHEIKTRFERESRAKAIESNRIIESLEAELAEAKGLLEEKQKNFLEMQQRLRKAFMRGVVNLNLEAMDVFNGAQFMDLMQEVEGNEAEHSNEDAPINESDDEFYVEEEAPKISVIRHH